MNNLKSYHVKNLFNCAMYIITKQNNKMKKVIEIPNEMHDEIKKRAEKNDRSVNKEITQLLKKALK